MTIFPRYQHVGTVTNTDIMLVIPQGEPLSFFQRLLALTYRSHLSWRAVPESNANT